MSSHTDQNHITARTRHGFYTIPSSVAASSHRRRSYHRRGRCPPFSRTRSLYQPPIHARSWRRRDGIASKEAPGSSPITSPSHRSLPTHCPFSTIAEPYSCVIMTPTGQHCLQRWSGILAHHLAVASLLPCTTLIKGAPLADSPSAVWAGTARGDNARAICQRFVTGGAVAVRA